MVLSCPHHISSMIVFQGDFSTTPPETAPINLPAVLVPYIWGVLVLQDGDVVSCVQLYPQSLEQDLIHSRYLTYDVY